MNLTEGESFLTLTLEEQPGAEDLHSCALTVTQDGQELYSLTVETYVSEGG
jgi:hypothetical protein